MLWMMDSAETGFEGMFHEGWSKGGVVFAAPGDENGPKKLPNADCPLPNAHYFHDKLRIRSNAH